MDVDRKNNANSTFSIGEVFPLGWTSCSLQKVSVLKEGQFSELKFVLESPPITNLQTIERDQKSNATNTNNHNFNTHFPTFLLAAAVTNKAENKDDGTGLCSIDG